MVHDNSVILCWEVDVRIIFPEHRPQGNMPELDPAVFLDQTAMEVWDKEDVGDSQTTEEDSKHDTCCLAGTKFLERWRIRGLDDEEQGEDGAGESKVDRDGAHRFLEWIFALQDAELECCEQQSGEGGGEDGCNSPGCCDLGDAASGPPPFDRRRGCEANTDQCADNSLRCGDWETGACSDDQPRRASSLSAAHCKNEDPWGRLEAIDGNDAILDGSSDSIAQSDRAHELCDHRQEADLGHGQGTCGDGGGIGVGDVVGAIPEAADAEEDGDEGDDPVILSDVGCWHLAAVTVNRSKVLMIRVWQKYCASVARGNRTGSIAKPSSSLYPASHP